MRVLKKTRGRRTVTGKIQEIKRVWPKGYKRFDSGMDEEKFEIKPQKYNFRLILLSTLVLLILWVFVIQPYIDKHPKKEEPIRVKLFNEDNFLQGSENKK